LSTKRETSEKLFPFSFFRPSNSLISYQQNLKNSQNFF